VSDDRKRAKGRRARWCFAANSPVGSTKLACNKTRRRAEKSSASGLGVHV
jgi:hypothetical protein